MRHLILGIMLLLASPRAKTFRVSFAEGCNDPWISQLYVNGIATEAKVENGNDDVGPWIFKLPSPLLIDTLGADLTTGGCKYQIDKVD